VWTRRKFLRSLRAGFALPLVARRPLPILDAAESVPQIPSQSSRNTAASPATRGPIWFELKKIPFVLENCPTPAKNAPETMPGGVAIFDYNSDGRPDIFFTNGANIATLKKDSPKYRNRLFRNDGNGVFTDVTDAAGLAGSGYDIGAAVGDYDNDGHPDLFVAGLHRSTLYHNNGDGTFTDVTVKSGLDTYLNRPDPEYGPLWTETAVWVDVNNDGLLDLFVINYMQWNYSEKPLCKFHDFTDYCSPKLYKGQPNQLFLNRGDGTFQDVSKEWGVRGLVGKGMGVGMADYDLDGRPDLFITNDTDYNFLLHNAGAKFEEVAFDAGVALVEDGGFISGMGVDFRDFNNDGYPDIAFVALNNQTFPLFQNNAKGGFREITTPSDMRRLSSTMSGFGAGLYDFDNDGWKDLFVSGGHVESVSLPGQPADQHNAIYRNLGPSGKWSCLREEAGLTASAPARHRGCAFGDLDGDGRIDVVVTALGQPAEIWMNRSEKAGHWLDVAVRGSKSNRDGIGARIKLVSKSGMQYNHMTTSTGYASSACGPVHFGLGQDNRADVIEIHWPSGIVQTLKDVQADRILEVTEPSKQS
jgi:hypothetical protein